MGIRPALFIDVFIESPDASYGPSRKIGAETKIGSVWNTLSLDNPVLPYTLLDRTAKWYA